MCLDHRQATAVELGTVMHPRMKRRKSVTKLTDIKHIANPKTSKYCLMTQDQDSSGELETHLYKVTGLEFICLFLEQRMVC
jgi:kinesin family protein 23